MAVVNSICRIRLGTLLSRLKNLVLFVLLCFLTPTLSSFEARAESTQPSNWRNADWSSAGLLPAAREDRRAAIYVMAARTGGLKGLVAIHSWIVTKAAGGARYFRYDKFSWGNPIRINALPADARWHSHEPEILLALHGDKATRLIPKIEKAVKAYPYSKPGDYRLWPGPNSNTFIAHVLKSVPELGLILPPEAVGRDYRRFDDFVTLSPDKRNLELSLGGYAGLAVGPLYGLEVRIGGLVFGVDIARPGIKLPGVGRVGP
jgi:hypothetical protein